jgi:hypothetical protein
MAVSAETNHKNVFSGRPHYYESTRTFQFDLKLSSEKRAPPVTRPQTKQATPANSSQEITSLQEQAKLLQQKIKAQKEISIPKFQSETKKIAKDLAATKVTIGYFGKNWTMSSLRKIP